MRRKLLKGMILIALAICMNMTTQAAYYAYTATVKNQIQLTKVKMRDARLASDSDAMDAYSCLASGTNAEKNDLYTASGTNAEKGGLYTASDSNAIENKASESNGVAM